MPMSQATNFALDVQEAMQGGKLFMAAVAVALDKYPGYSMAVGTEAAGGFHFPDGSEALVTKDGFEIKEVKPRMVIADMGYGHLMTVKEFKDACDAGGFIDDDGYGQMSTDGLTVGAGLEGQIYPSDRATIPENVTHVLCYNR